MQNMVYLNWYEKACKVMCEFESMADLPNGGLMDLKASVVKGLLDNTYLSVYSSKWLENINGINVCKK